LPALVGRFDHDLDGIAYQVDKHLLDLDSVCQYDVSLGIEPAGDGDPGFASTDQGECAGILDQLCETLDPAIAFAACNKLSQTTDDMPCTQCLVGRFTEGLA